MNTVTVIGAGLAGCEAAHQLAKRGIQVRLYEMKPKKMSPGTPLSGICGTGVFKLIKGGQAWLGCRNAQGGDETV